VDITLYKTLAYVLCGITAGLAAVILTAKFGVADTGAGTGYELYAIAAVVVGGTSLSGGRGTVAGTVAGALTIAVLEAGLVLMGAPDTLQRIIIGAVIVATVMLDRSRRSR
jgi:ribose/xylose/arabinose/galactoside ABC-type transport system permease subunit